MGEIVWGQGCIGVVCTGFYGAGLLRLLENAGIEVLEVTAPDPSVRRRKGKGDTLDTQNAAHAAHAGIRTVTPRPVTAWSSACAS